MVTVQLTPFSCNQDMTVMITLHAALALRSNIIIVVLVVMFIFYLRAILLGHKGVYGCKIDGADAPLRVIGSLLFGSFPLRLLVLLFARLHETDLLCLWNTVATSMG